MFKNIAPGTRIDFDFPITAFVGPNGSGKTSALHALYGAPAGQTTSDYWFSTAVDPIAEGSGGPNRFIYGHWHDAAKCVVETRKARVSKASKPDYFEPTKAVAGDGMALVVPPSTGLLAGQDKDRWNPVARKVLYLNFRSELSAFDKYFFFGLPKATTTLKTRQDRLRAWAPPLKRVFDAGDKKATYYGRSFVEGNRTLTAEELDDISFILGKDYSSARVVVHSLFDHLDGVSVLFETKKNQTYSEAFAGSGELAVASLVKQLHEAENFTLILLDEPEVSLHPAAQKRLLSVIASHVVTKKHQVVFTTHSTSLVEDLPDNAIKVFLENAGGKFEVIPSSHPYSAFTRLGAAAPDVLRILVEDDLAKLIVERSLKSVPHLDNMFTVEFLPGGARAYYASRIPTLMHSPRDTVVLLDGDVKPATAFVDPSTIASAQDDTLEKLVKDQTGVDVTLGADGGNDVNATQKLNALRRQYLGFLFRSVRFLPETCPEAIVLRSIGADVPPTADGAKAALATRVEKLGLPLNAKTISTTALVFFTQALEAGSTSATAAVKSINDALIPFFARLGRE
ncbi:MAG: ATP-binding protein [Myxococcaceae bacterium]